MKVLRLGQIAIVDSEWAARDILLLDLNMNTVDSKLLWLEGQLKLSLVYPSDFQHMYQFTEQSVLTP